MKKKNQIENKNVYIHTINQTNVLRNYKFWKKIWPQKNSEIFLLKKMVLSIKCPSALKKNVMWPFLVEKRNFPSSRRFFFFLFKSCNIVMFFLHQVDSTLRITDWSSRGNGSKTLWRQIFLSFKSSYIYVVDWPRLYFLLLKVLFYCDIWRRECPNTFQVDINLRNSLISAFYAFFVMVNWRWWSPLPRRCPVWKIKKTPWIRNFIII